MTAYNECPECNVPVHSGKCRNCGWTDESRREQLQPSAWRDQIMRDWWRAHVNDDHWGPVLYTAQLLKDGKGSDEDKRELVHALKAALRNVGTLPYNPGSRLSE